MPYIFVLRPMWPIMLMLGLDMSSSESGVADSSHNGSWKSTWPACRMKIRTIYLVFNFGWGEYSATVRLHLWDDEGGKKPYCWSMMNAVSCLHEGWNGGVSFKDLMVFFMSFEKPSYETPPIMCDVNVLDIIECVVPYWSTQLLNLKGGNLG